MVYLWVIAIIDQGLNMDASVTFGQFCHGGTISTLMGPFEIGHPAAPGMLDPFGQHSQRKSLGTRAGFGWGLATGQHARQRRHLSNMVSIGAKKGGGRSPPHFPSCPAGKG